ncbi:Ras-related protein RabA1f [Tanacetum coccineum]
MFVGNKADLRHSQAVLPDEAKAFSEREDIFFMETSALEPLNIDKAVLELVTHIYRKALGQFPPTSPFGQEPQIEMSATLLAPVQQPTSPPPPQSEMSQVRKRDIEDAMIDCIEWICEQQVHMMTHLGLRITRPLPPSTRDTDSG